MFNTGVDYTHHTRETNHDPPSQDSPTGEMASSFSWTCPFKCPTSRTLCWDESTPANVTLKKRVQVFNYVVNYVVDKFTCLTTQEDLQCLGDHCSTSWLTWMSHQHCSQTYHLNSVNTSTLLICTYILLWTNMTSSTRPHL